MSKYKTYPEYKSSEVEWLGKIPKHWNVKKIKYSAVCTPSNIDKKSKNGEEAVILCNYTDVYYNEEIDSNLDFMKATATDEQIKKFTLRKNDVIITKDSEDPNDIAVPTLIIEDVNSLVCGYHLALIRATNSYGPFLKRYFNSKFARSFFATKANGLTRYGLGTYPLVNAPVPMPPFTEQETIASFLDSEIGKINQLIKKQEKLIVLLEEKRQAVINHAVTKGLDPSVPMKDSGVEWLGEIPKHWDIVPMKRIVEVKDGTHNTPKYVTPSKYSFPLITSKDFFGNRISFETSKFISREDHFEIIKRSNTEAGDVLMSMIGGNIGKAVIVKETADFSIKNVALFKAKAFSNTAEYILYYLQSGLLDIQISLLSRGGAQGFLSLGDLRNLQFFKVPKNEMKEIVRYLNQCASKFDNLIDKAQSAIELLQERRTALISAAVTGKIDVRGFKNNEDVL